jgi:hypothetical protein
MTCFYPCDKPRLHEDLQRLERIRGYCILIDMVASVALKDRGLYDWCAGICNIIGKSREWLCGLSPDEENKGTDGLRLRQWGLLPLKIIGDCVMFYIPEASMPKGASALTIFSSLRYIVQEPVYPKLEVQVAAAFCNDAYNISFVTGTNDVHGKDIDLTFRLLEKAKSREILMNDEFYNRVRDLQNNYWPEFSEIREPSREILKGFKEPVQVYRWCDPQSESQPRCLKPAENGL